MATGFSLLTARQLFEWGCFVLDLLAAAAIVAGIIRRERAGRILLDLGRLAGDRSTVLLVVGAMQILLGLTGMLFGARDYRWSYYIFFLLAGVNSIDGGLRRFVICERGILARGGFLGTRLYAWGDIRLYDIYRATLRLNLRDKGWIACARVPLEYQDELDALFASRLRKLQDPLVA